MKTLLVLLSAMIVGSTALVVLRQGKTVYWNPIDSKAYEADWRDYRSGTSRPASLTRTRLDQVRLLSTQKAFEQELGAGPLAEFCKKIEAAVDRSVDQGTSPYDLLIEVSVSSTRPPSFQMATQGEAPQAELQQISAALTKLAEVKSRETDLKFQLQFTIGGGTK